ncbi:MAG: 4-(cytidine 5'-diphospho)-2-C-methyl-D-erythritol kinase [Nitrospirales bacterium]
MPKVDEVRVRAPAKVNLILKVLGRLPNGYHEVWSVMQSVNLFDLLSLRRGFSPNDIRLTCDTAAVPLGKDNIVYRATELVLKKASIDEGVEVHLEKQIPMGAGLGGGSSDAAATIFGLVQLFQLQWSISEMAALGATLGSDVPFFFSMPQALIRGWGQEVVPLTVTGTQWILLVKPEFPIETGWAYQQLAKSRSLVPTLSKDLQGIERGEVLDFDDILPLMENDFEPVLFPEISRLGELKAQILSLGSEVALLSGSGSTIFGVFAQEETALKAMEVIAGDSTMQVFCVSTGSRGFALT